MFWGLWNYQEEDGIYNSLRVLIYVLVFRIIYLWLHITFWSVSIYYTDGL